MTEWPIIDTHWQLAIAILDACGASRRVEGTAGTPSCFLERLIIGMPNVRSPLPVLRTRPSRSSHGYELPGAA